jgi:hypothetical protein
MSYQSGLLGLDPGDQIIGVIACSPYSAEKIRWVEVAVFAQEIAVTAAAVHQIWVEFAAQFGTGFGDNPR